MNLEQIIQALDLQVLTKECQFARKQVKSGYCSDLLSCVMAGAEPEGIWVTLMAHGNIVAVAALLDLAAIIITENAQPEQETIEQANEKGVTLLSTPHPSFHVVGKLWELGVRVSKK